MTSRLNVMAGALAFCFLSFASLDELIARIDVRYGVYEGRHFREKKFEDYLKRHKHGSEHRTAI